jgi:DNA ligase 1
MQHFARLLDNLSTQQSRNAKISLMASYFRTMPDPDRGWALAALTGGSVLKVPLRRLLSSLMAAHIDLFLYKVSRDYVGDTAETVALLWPENKTSVRVSITLGEVVDRIQNCPPGKLEATTAELLDGFDITERWAFLKFIGGALRVGVSARLAKMALAEATQRTLPEIEEVWYAVKPPYADLFAWVEDRGLRPETKGLAVFRPLMLATPIEDQDWATLVARDFAAEWKWDGIRVQIASEVVGVKMFSRAGEDISSAFPEIAEAFADRDVTVDGELLVIRDSVVASFNELQQRLNRKTVSTRMLIDYPVHVRLYDLLFINGEDLRPLSFEERRLRLENWHSSTRPARTDVSQLITFKSFDELNQLHAGARGASIEGLMLKRRASPYIAGRPKGHWFKWKRTALTLDCVLMYAQRGSGKRSSFYSDYTFGVWRTVGDAQPELVPVGKAYSGFTDAELKNLDKFIRHNTVETFGPVRAVKPEIVFEVAFDSVQLSKRHKSGIAMRFPRIHRIRWDKPANEADTLETVVALLVTGDQHPNVAAGLVSS